MRYIHCTCRIILKWKSDGNKLCRKFHLICAKLTCNFCLTYQLKILGSLHCWVFSPRIFWSTEYSIPMLGGMLGMLGEMVGGMLEGMV